MFVLLMSPDNTNKDYSAFIIFDVTKDDIKKL